MKKVIRLTEADLENIVRRIINEEDEKWIKKATKDMDEGALTDYCGGKITCECIRKALKGNTKSRKRAMMYVNMTGKCKRNVRDKK